MIHPETNSHDLIRHARAVVSINSKVGAEALMQNCRTLVIGRPFYAAARNAVRVCLEEERSLPIESNEPDGVDTGFFAQVFASCHPGELYQEDPDNVNGFADVLVGQLQSAVDGASASEGVRRRHSRRARPIRNVENRTGPWERARLD